MAILMITHDLGVVASVAHRALVMYAGRVAEQSDVLGLFDKPRHPYTAGLFKSLPRLDALDETGQPPRLQPIDGNVPDALSFPAGCRFHPRCPYASDVCRREVPTLKPQPGRSEHGGRLAACWKTDDEPEVDYLSAAPPAAALGNPEAGK
jgi:oligopeptide/dipeptide ABC transporter ATP-binding protein